MGMTSGGRVTHSSPLPRSESTEVTAWIWQCSK